MLAVKQPAFDASKRSGYPLRRSIYPLQRALFKTGCVIGILVGVVSASILTGASIALAFWLAGFLWRENELPVQVFCILYQWMFIVTGYFAFRYYGTHPSQIVLGDIELAVFLSLMGLVAISCGIRIALPDVRGAGSQTARKSEARDVEYDPKKLFWVVIGLFTVNWLVETFPMAILFNAAQAIHSIFLFRYLFFLVLLMVVVRQRTGYQYGLLAFMFVLIPELTSSMAKFKDVFFMLLIVLLASWKPWSKSCADRVRNRQILAISIALCFVIVAAGLIWTGGMKGDWRTALRTGTVSGSPIEKIEEFGRHLDRSIARFDSGSAIHAFLSRLSSSQGYFSRVVTIVPDRLPYEDGALTWRAIRHILMPRLLFPEKENLGGDSWLVRKYAGVHVAGDESYTSVGLGYMAEFYIDFGAPLMFVPLFLLGLLIGYIQRLLNRISPSPYIAEAAVTGLLVQHFIGYGSHLTKLLGGLVQSTLVFVIVIVSLGSWLHTYLQLGGTKTTARQVGRQNGIDSAY
jgi:hypothetical protein